MSERIICDNDDCEATTVSHHPDFKEWRSVTIAPGIVRYEDNEYTVQSKTLHFCPDCWQEAKAAIQDFVDLNEWLPLVWPGETDTEYPPERSGKGKQIREGYSHRADDYIDTLRPSEMDKPPEWYRHGDVPYMENMLRNHRFLLTMAQAAGNMTQATGWDVYSRLEDAARQIDNDIASNRDGYFWDDTDTS